jgi:hypothetical protein
MINNSLQKRHICPIRSGFDSYWSVHLVEFLYGGDGGTVGNILHIGKILYAVVGVKFIPRIYILAKHRKNSFTGLKSKFEK